MQGSFAKPICNFNFQTNMVIKSGRRHLMEMIEDLPESSSELLLKDIVDDQQNTEESQKATTIERKNQKARMPQLRKTSKRSQISRSESVDSGVFLLKIFLPSSIGSKKKLKAERRIFKSGT